MLYLVAKKKLRSVKEILKEFEDNEEELEEEELIASIIISISDYSKVEIEKEKKLNKLLNKSTTIRQCQRTQETQPQKESSKFFSNKTESVDRSKYQGIIISHKEIIKKEHFTYSK
ncbi:hypothetical protein O181_094821 [Austropuccinia psidii MF-1]|uniref:Uncharacterized protein n=1 Tax=Austropuccinia psidii MF-1 TaxID=1389203 RepID=A0A9Q3J484_9BASI|nr:hypothetical protein [Austropuccinia psidii MF-1]